MKTINLLFILLFTFNIAHANWISILAFSVDTSNSKIKVNFKIEESVMLWHINRISAYYSPNNDTLNIRVFRKLDIVNLNNTYAIDSSVTISPNNFNSICYLNFYNARDTNSDIQYYKDLDSFDIDTATYNFNHCSPLSVAENKTKNSISVYPNPSTGNLYLTNINVESIKDILIADIYGKIWSIKYSKSNSQISIDTKILPNGRYHLRIKRDKQFYDADFVKME